jgi:probable rRNA maturation factor
MQLNIFKEKPIHLPRKRLNLLFYKIASKELSKKSKGVINLIFTTDKQMHELNKSFRNKDRSTDVLSFNIDEPENDNSIFGEIYISVNMAKKQAISYNASLTEETLRLSCHGMLHLMGYDHIKKSDEKRMKEKEEFYLSQA